MSAGPVSPEAPGENLFPCLVQLLEGRIPWLVALSSASTAKNGQSNFSQAACLCPSLPLSRSLAIALGHADSPEEALHLKVS